MSAAERMQMLAESVAVVRRPDSAKAEEERARTELTAALQAEGATREVADELADRVVTAMAEFADRLADATPAAKAALAVIDEVGAVIADLHSRTNQEEKK